MTWYGWGLIGLYVVSVLHTLATIGRPRRVTDNTTAVVSVITGALLIVAVLTVGTGTGI